MSTNAARVTEISLAHSYSEFDSETGEIFDSTESKSSENYLESSESTGRNLDSEDRGSADRFQETLDSRATELLNSVPGIETLTALVAIDPEDLSRGARVDYLSAVERQTG